MTDWIHDDWKAYTKQKVDEYLAYILQEMKKGTPRKEIKGFKEWME